MTVVDVVVLLCVVGAALSGVLTAFHPNILYAAISLVFTLLSVAGLYGALGADFLAVLQVAIYVGATIVVILFAVMMSAEIYRTRFLDNARKIAWPLVASVAVMAVLIQLIGRVKWERVESLQYNNTTQQIGKALIGPYALAFQFVAVVLLLGLIGAVVVARPAFDSHKDEGGKK